MNLKDLFESNHRWFLRTEKKKQTSIDQFPAVMRSKLFVSRLNLSAWSAWITITNDPSERKPSALRSQQRDWWRKRWQPWLKQLWYRLIVAAAIMCKSFNLQYLYLPPVRQTLLQKAVELKSICAYEMCGSAPGMPAAKRENAKTKHENTKTRKRENQTRKRENGKTRKRGNAKKQKRENWACAQKHLEHERYHSFGHV